MKRSLFGILVIFCFFIGNAQSPREIIIDSSYNGKVFLDFLNEFEIQNNIDFICNEEKMEALTVNGITERQRLSEFLNNFSYNYRLQKISEKIFFIADRSFEDRNAFNNDNYIILKQPAASSTTISGNVIDGITKEPLIGAKVFFPSMKLGVLTDMNGSFTFNDVPIGLIHLQIEYVGYETGNYLIGFSKYGTATNFSTALFTQSKELLSVTITAERLDENVTSQLTGVEKLSIETIRSLPTFLGEIDPIRSLTTLPGVSTSGELASGFNVRGGEAGQNLILQDGAIIYNPSHLFGFFSAFNPDMVSNVALYKGGGPANFGSRVSSVLDISLRNGDALRHTISGGVGLVSSRLTAEGPILKNRSSYLIGGRISYCNWLIQATDNIALKNSAAQFRDVTGKLFHTLNQNNLFSLSFYNGYDDFQLATDSVFSWGTSNISLKWDHTFDETTHSTFTAFKSSYFSKVISNNEIDAFTYDNSVKNLGLKYDVTFNINQDSKLTGGFESAFSVIEPGRLMPQRDATNVGAQNMSNQSMIEGALYLQSDLKITSNVSLSAGLRYSHFLRLGKESIYDYDFNNMNGRYPSVIDTISYGSKDLIKKFSGIEPRISIRYLVGKNASVKASYFRGYQYMHLISNTTSTTPQDYWVASGTHLKPQIGDQFSVGYFKNIKQDLYEFSIEGFYKDIGNTVDYIEGADITLNPILEAGLSQGKGLTYGLEFFLKKKSGQLSGWLAYTYSRSLRKFDATTGRIEINQGKYYASAFDQPNIISLVTNYQLGMRANISANFNYSTGRPITIPVSKFAYDVYLSVLNYSSRNEYRIPDYHRLDLSFTLKGKPRQNKRFKSEWIFSVFNVYGRKNAYSVFFNRYGTASKLSILGSIFPSLTYSFRFQ